MFKFFTCRTLFLVRLSRHSISVQLLELYIVVSERDRGAEILSRIEQPN
jgi:hypothetical protein